MKPDQLSKNQNVKDAMGLIPERKYTQSRSHSSSTEILLFNYLYIFYYEILMTKSGDTANT